MQTSDGGGISYDEVRQTVRFVNSKAMGPIKVTTAISIAALALPISVSAQDSAAGRRIAEAECAGCHSVGKEGRSPLPAAPAFREFGRRWSIDEGALGERVSMAHGDMPEFIFEPDEIADLVAYLLSIQEK
jgi:mono/diheme cytochrome c family protein